MADDYRNEPGLTSALREGGRFVVRRRLPAGSTHAFTDVVGDVVEMHPHAVVLRTRRHGDVSVDLAEIVAVKEISHQLGRRGQPHRAVGVEDMERLMVAGWVSPEHEPLGSWVLRAAGGYTGRANSALAVGQPDRPLEAALEHVAAWYTRRDLPPMLQVPLAPGCPPEQDPLVHEARTRGWEWFQLTDVMTAAAREVVRSARPQTSGELLQESAELSELWWSLADDRMLAAPQGARAVLTGSPEQRFLMLTADGSPAARARIAFAHGWGGVYAVATQPEFRRRGLGSTIVGLCAQAAAERGVESLYLQVSADNAPAVGLYERLGFVQHHQYVYLRQATR